MAGSDRSRRAEFVAETLLLAGLVLAVSAVAFTGGAAANHDGSGNFTVELPDPEDHEPGNRNASANFLIVNTEQFDTLRDIYAFYPDGVPSRCYNRDTRVFGIDRENDDPGVDVDESAIPYASDTERSRHGILMEFYPRDDVSPSVRLDAGDQFVVSVETCVWNPEEPGWYQIRGNITGRTPDGDMESVPFESHYFYICDCENERAARQQLGPPPSEATPTPAATATATPTATATATPTATASTGTETATPSPTPAATETRTDTRTPTAAPTERPATPTATPDAATPTPTAVSTATAEPTATAPATTTGDRTPTRSAVGTTATSGSGPGPGVVGALVALVAAGVIGHRRRR